MHETAKAIPSKNIIVTIVL